MKKTFLTARMGLIDTCPDQEYLAQKLLPVYSKIQLGEIPTPPLETVPKEVALAAKCPRPDWNYLRWDGYSDEKYRGIISGSALLKLPHYGKKVPLELQVRSYYSGGNLALLLVDWSDDYPEPWGDLSVNLGYAMEKDCAFVDVNDMGRGDPALDREKRPGDPHRADPAKRVCHIPGIPVSCRQAPGAGRLRLPGVFRKI